jgi:chitodextrinase
VWILLQRSWRVFLAGAIALAALPAATAAAADPVVYAVGDIACQPGDPVTSTTCHERQTSDVVVGGSASRALALGDLQYNSASLSNFQGSYDRTWGRFKSLTSPVLGNHEGSGSGYFDYFYGSGVSSGPFGARGKGFYSFDVGAWHLIGLNSNCSAVPCAAGSEQERWLRADLTAHPTACTLAYWHHPRFSSGHDGDGTFMQALWQDLYDANADLVLVGHSHDYERFAPQNASGSLDRVRGIREFVVGTGGAFFTGIGTAHPNSEVRQNTIYGVLKLTLHPTGYDWRFVPEAGKTFNDSGTEACHGPGGPAPSDTQSPTVPANLTAGASSSTRVDLSWNASTDNVGVTGYEVFRGSALLGTASGTSYADTTAGPGTGYSYQVRALDAANNRSGFSNTATATTPSGSTVKVSPDADAMVSAASAGTNYGTSYLRADGGTDPAVDSYLKFTVSGVSGSVQSAKLRLYAYSGTVDGPAVYTTATGWSESAITWTNRPTTTSPATDDKAAIATNSWVEYNVSSFVTGNGTYGFRLATASTDGVDFRSREHTDATLRPELVLSVGQSGDTQAPTVPANLTANASSSTRVDLAWNASTDNVGVTGYEVFRGGAYLATASGTSYSDTAAASGAAQSYQVRALDAAGNRSGLGNTATATTPPAPDTQAPSVPANLTASASSATQVDLSWSASTDNVGVTGYEVYRNGIPLTTKAGTSHSDTPVNPGTAYTYQVRAFDTAGNRSAFGSATTVTTPTGNTVKISPEADARVFQSTATTNYGTVDLRVDGGTDPAVDSYLKFTVSGLASPVQSAKLRLYAFSGTADGPAVYTTGTGWSESGVTWNNRPASTSGATDDKGTIATNSWVEYNVAPFVQGNGTYSFRLATSSTDGVDIRSREFTDATLRPQLVVMVAPPDTQAPATPSGLHANAVSATRVDLSWNAATDNVGVTGYEVFRDGAYLATASGASYSDISASPATAYSYQVRALDAANNRSGFSDTATATTPEPPDTQPPTPPGNLIAGAPSPTQVDLSWSASQDNVGVTGYEIYRDGAYLATTAATSYSDVTASPATSYSYQVRALDAAGNRSNFSNPATITTPTPPDTEPPTAPSGLDATAPDPTRVDLDWSGSTDNVGVTGYEVFRDGAYLATASGTRYSDISVTPATAYTYEVRALDAAENRSDFSNTASITTPTTTQAVSFIADSDAPVEEANPLSNYGAENLRADGGGDPGVESYLRFTVAGVAGPVQGAKLRVFAYTDTADGPAAYTTTSGWSESGLTGINWLTRPPLTSPAIDDKGAIAAGEWVEYDVTPVVTGDGTYDFALATTSSDEIDFNSREQTSNPPQLVVTF